MRGYMFEKELLYILYRDYNYCQIFEYIEAAYVRICTKFCEDGTFAFTIRN